MKTLERKEMIAVAVSIFVVGFFFIFGQFVLSFLGGFFTNNETQEMTQKEPEVIVEDVIVGQGDPAVLGDRVVVHYTGRFVSGEVFDSSVTRGEPIQFVLGSGQVIQGWEEGLQGMQIGGKRLLSIPPEKGYGPNDYGPIPGGSTLLFEVELLRIDK